MLCLSKATYFKRQVVDLMVVSSYYTHAAHDAIAHAGVHVDARNRKGLTSLAIAAQQGERWSQGPQH
jgi:hypothetical protein